MLKTNKKKVTTIEDEQRRERRGATIAGDIDKMKDKKEWQQLLVKMNKRKEKGIVVAANEQRIQKRSNINCC